MYTPSYLSTVFERNDDEEMKTVYLEIERRLQNDEPTSANEIEYYSRTKLIREGATALTKCKYCEPLNFSYKFLWYQDDLTGGSTYIKVDRINGVFSQYTIPKDEIIRDIDYLKKAVPVWLDKVNSFPVQPETIQSVVRKETLDYLKILPSVPFNNTEDELKYLKGVLLSRHFYHLALRTYERLGSAPYKVILHDMPIYITPFSIVHTLFRHYAPEFNPHEKKSKHSPDIDILNHFNTDLEYIFSKITSSGLRPDPNDIRFKYKGQVYHIWTIEFTDGNNPPYRRIQTFYPVDSEKEIEELKNEFNYNELEHDIGIYIRK